MSTCSFDAVDALVFEELPEEETQAVRAHLATCKMCELQAQRLKADRAAVSARARGPAPDRQKLLVAIEKRRARTKSARRFVGMAAVAAVLFLMLLLPRGVTSPRRTMMLSLDPSLVCSLDEASIARVETRFGACLVATPRTLPDAEGLCL
ncbi:MAG: anti-sigma factor family protein [Myxococcaceae bacterium]